MLRIGIRNTKPLTATFTAKRLVSGTKVVGATSPNLSKPLGIDQTIESNIKSHTNRLAKTLTKFWENVDTQFNEATNKYEVQLDGKTLKTPLGFPLALPKNKKQLSYLLQHEWSNLPSLKIQTNSLPLTSLAARSIDLETATSMDDGDLLAKVGKIDDIKYNLLRYLDTDTCLIFTTVDEYDGKLRKRQNELYLPLIQEFEDFFSAWGKSKQNLLPPDSSVTISYLDCETDGLRGNRQSITTQNVVLDWMNDLSIYELVALEKAVLTSKSFLCGATLLRSSIKDQARQANCFQLNKKSPDSYYHKTIDEIVELGNMETIFQTNQWGEVEDTHDVDKVDWLRSLSSAAILCY